MSYANISHFKQENDTKVLLWVFCRRLFRYTGDSAELRVVQCMVLRKKDYRKEGFQVAYLENTFFFVRDL